MPALPLQGIRVIDMTVVWAGPFASALLGDMGAEVIRVESTQRWDRNSRGQFAGADQMRARGGAVNPGAPPWELSANFNTVGRNKKSVTMDLTRPEGRDVFLRLVGESDIFVENNSPDVVQRLGISYEVLSQVNRRLIMISMPAFGSSGPYRHFRAYGANIEAVVGHTLLRGYEDTDPTHSTNVFLADAMGGATAAFAALAALRYRMTTGKGQFIDMSQAENMTHALSQAFMDYSMNKRVQTTLGNRHPSRAPQGVYACRGEDSWIALSCGTDEEFASLCEVIGKPYLANDPRFSDSLARHRWQDDLDHEISNWTAQKDDYEAFHELQRFGVPSAPVLTVAEVFADRHLRERDVWQEVTHPWAGTHWYLKPVIGQMSKTPLSIWSHAPTLGQHNEYVYEDLLGYSEEEYRWFVENGHVGERYEGAS